MYNAEKNYSNKEYCARIMIKTIAIIASVYGIVKTYYGWISITYFTDLSNIFMIIVLAVFLVQDIITLINKRVVVRRNILYILKFLATLSVALTFFIFMFIIVPIYTDGIMQAYFENGAGSLGVHFICPLLSIIDFCLFDYEYVSSKKHAILGVIPPLTYVILVVIASQLGMRWCEIMYAPYNFLNYGAKTGWFGFDLSQMGMESLGIGVFYVIAAILPVFIGSGFLLLWIKNKRKRVIEKQINIM